MSATLNVYHAVVRRLLGQDDGTGSLESAIREVTLSSGKALIERVFVLAAAEKKVVWNWADTGGFEYLAIIPVEEAYIRGAHRIDVVTSESDQTPTAADGPWNHWSCSCFAPKAFDSDRAWRHATAATHVGDTAGLPTSWTSGSAVNGVISSVALWNTEASAKSVKLYVVQ